MKRNMNKTGWIVFVAGCMAVSSGWASTFNGAGDDQFFSNTNNWDVFPTAGEGVSFAGNSTSISEPAQVDAAFPALTGANRLKRVGVSSAAPQTTYVEICSGGNLEAVTVNIGWVNVQPTRKGNLTLKTGGRLQAGNGALSGALNVGQNVAAGQVTVEDGATFRATKILVRATTGTLVYEFGTNSVTAMEGTSTSTGSVNQVDGLIRLDLGALNASGTYTLIDSKGSQFIGALKTWLDDGGGSRSGAGDTTNTNFEIVNSAPDLEWTLTTADVDERDLVFTVTIGGAAGYYTAWAADFGLTDPEETGAMTADPDGDFFDNLAEYGLGGNPTNSADQGHVPTSRLLEDGGTNWLEYVYFERSDKGSIGLNYNTERGLDLVDAAWTHSGIVVGGSGMLDADFNAVTNRIATDAENQQFVRLRVGIQ